MQFLFSTLTMTLVIFIAGMEEPLNQKTDKELIKELDQEMWVRIAGYLPGDSQFLPMLQWSYTFK